MRMGHLVSKKVNGVGEGERKKRHSLTSTLILIHHTLNICVIINPFLCNVCEYRHSCICIYDKNIVYGLGAFAVVVGSSLWIGH